MVCPDCRAVVGGAEVPLPDNRTDAYVSAFMVGAAALLQTYRDDDEPILDQDLNNAAHVMAGHMLDAMLAADCVELKDG